MRVPLSIGAIHFIGIGGIGMSGIAEVMRNLGYQVQGSDAADSHNGAPYLVFTRYGTETFLSRIVFSTDRTFDLPRSSREKELAARLNSNERVAVSIGAAR